MRKIAILTLCLLSLAASGTASAQIIINNIGQSHIYFRTGSAVLDTSYRENGKVLKEFVKGVNKAMSDEKVTVEAVTIETGASPEGGVEYNEKLAMDRAKSIRKYLVDNLPLSATQIKAWSVGADWEGLAVAIRNSDCQWKDEILDAIAQTGVRTDSDTASKEKCLSLLKRIDGGKAWNWMMDNVFADLRQGAGTLRCIVSRTDGYASVRDTLIIIHEYEGPDAEWYLARAAEKATDASTRRVLNSLEKKPKRFHNDSLYKVPAVALRSNLLVPLMNIGIEVPLGNRWSVSADWYCPWAFRGIMNRFVEPQSACFQLLGGAVEGRYWLGAGHQEKEQYKKYRLRGHSLALTASGGYYDFQYDWKGRQGEYAALGIGYMYALPLGKGNVHLEFEISAGYGISWYRGYEVHETGGNLIGNYEDASGTNFWHGIVPVKAGVNLVIPIYEKEQ